MQVAWPDVVPLAITVQIQSLHMKKLLLILFIAPIFLASNLAYAQAVVQGVVKDGDGAAVVGATVTIIGTSIHAITDVNGSFSIKAQEVPFSLQIRLVGFKAQDIEIYELPEEPLEISLIDDSLLDEVVVTPELTSAV
jgi:hypothetical protein